MATFPFTEGTFLIWHSTYVDTYASYIIGKSATPGGAAAEAADSRNRRRSGVLERRFKSQPVAVETSGSLGQSTAYFLKDLGRRIPREGGDRRATEYLFQRVSLVVPRGNATAIHMGAVHITDGSMESDENNASWHTDSSTNSCNSELISDRTHQRQNTSATEHTSDRTHQRQNTYTTEHNNYRTHQRQNTSTTEHTNDRTHQ